MRLKIILFIIGHRQDSTNDGVAEPPQLPSYIDI